MKSIFLFCLLAVTLTACGGGGGSPTPSIEGMWTDTKNTAIVGGTLVETDGTAWGLGVDTNTNSISIATGKFTTTGNTFSGSLVNLVILPGGSTYLTSTSTGTFVERQTANVTSNFGNGVSVSSTLIFAPEYDTPFTVTPRSYTGNTSSLQSSTINVTPNGAISGSAGTCTFNGMLTYTHKNYERVSITFHGGSCAAGTSTLGGVVVGDATAIAVILNDGSGKPIGAFYR